MMQDEMEEAGLGVDHIPTEPGSLEEDRHSVESMGTWLAAAIGLTALGAGIGFALAGWPY